MVDATLKSPGPGYRPLNLSDRSVIWMPPEATPAHWVQAKQQGEASLDAKYQKQAADTGQIVNTPGKVYSATAVRPAGGYGNVMAWLEQHAGGNALNRNPAAQSVNEVAAPVTQAGSRIATAAVDAIPVVRGYDLGITGENIVKHLASKLYPSLANLPDAPTAVGALRNALGTQELSPDATPAQRVIESALSAATTRAPPTTASVEDAFGRTGASYLGGEAGNRFGGEAGQFAGSFAGGTFPESAPNVLTRATAPWFRGRNTDTVSDAANRQGIQPSTGAVSNAFGRLMSMALAAVPVAGNPSLNARERFNDSIQNRQGQIAEEVYGGAPPENITNEDIGGALRRGAQQGAANISQRAEDAMHDLTGQIVGNTPLPGGTTPTQPTNLRSVYYGPAGYPKFYTGGVSRLERPFGLSQWPAHDGDPAADTRFPERLGPDAGRFRPLPEGVCRTFQLGRADREHVWSRQGRHEATL